MAISPLKITQANSSRDDAPKRAPGKWIGYATLCLVCFAGYLFASKLGLKAGLSDPVMFYLFIWGSLPVALALLVARKFSLEKEPLGIFFGTLTGVLGAAGQLAMLNALAASDANTSVVGAITGLYPMVTAVLAYFLLRERLKSLQVLGLVLAALAIVIFATDPSMPFSMKDGWHEHSPQWLRPVGVVLVAWGVVGIFQKLATNRISAESTIVWQTLGFLFFLPFALPSQPHSSLLSGASAYGLLAGTLTNLGSWFLFAALHCGGKASVVVPFTALYPLIVVLLAPLVLQESINLLQGGGVVLAVAAIILLSIRFDDNHKA
ncbi:MAG: DMT family transporter [Acidobacteria bacterium]|nr:DMT family transporter [Acidobacteriota bacterium]MCI0621372.1 DMT family transporter [Acidobacteriota bacterium]MCI0719642.1 DMT family transporter [Acidobacteriota bacterium]